MKEPGTIVACGIVKKELITLAEQHQWNTELRFLDSSLHTDLGKLYAALDGSLKMPLVEPVAVVYGTCHPLMRTLLQHHGAYWRMRQNCIEMLLGANEFKKHIEAGAFFLLEDWAHQWERVTTQALGSNEELNKYLFRSEHNYILCIHTPCSGDFTDKATEIERKTGLPLRWLNISLEHFEHYLQNTFDAFGAKE